MILGIKFDFSAITNDAIVVCVVGYLVVFVALVLLFFVFSNLPKILAIKLSLKRKPKANGNEEVTGISMTGEVNAAIATALYLYFNELHDEESNVITIKKVSKFYSPWSSKIYGLRNFSRR